MHEPATALHTVDLASLGERLSALRLCDAASLTTMRHSLEQHGQLTALTVFRSSLKMVCRKARIHSSLH